MVPLVDTLTTVLLVMDVAGDMVRMDVKVLTTVLMITINVADLSTKEALLHHHLVLAHHLALLLRALQNPMIVHARVLQVVTADLLLLPTMDLVTSADLVITIRRTAAGDAAVLEEAVMAPGVDITTLAAHLIPLPFPSTSTP